MRYIKVKSCNKCPYKREDNGGGYCEPFITCEKFHFMLIDDDIWNDLNKIHKDCKLDKEK